MAGNYQREATAFFRDRRFGPFRQNASAILERFYVPQLDGLRFTAFLLVFMNHFSWPGGFFKAYGWMGVDLFFVISAFLFTSLLHAEKQKTGSINICLFYLRRLLRIVPLYLFFIAVILIAFSTMIVWDTTLLKRLIAMVTFTDNLVTASGRGWNGLPYSVHLWTLSFEMQFYAIIPFGYLVLARMNRIDRLIALGWVLTLSLLARLVLLGLGYKHPTIYLVPFLRPEPMLLGIALAFWYIDGQPAWPWALAFATAVVLFDFMLRSGVNISTYSGPWQYLVYAIAATIMGVFVCAAIRGPYLFKQILAAAPLRFLGKISYGLYVYHLLAIAMIPTWLEGPAGFATGILLTIAMSSASYYIIERPFLKLKDHYAIIASRPA